MIYLLHFNKPYKQARHYLGYARHLQSRLKRHDAGQGARLMAAVAKAGIGYIVARTWPEGDRTLERQLHNRNNNPALCPICTGKEAQRA